MERGRNIRVVLDRDISRVNSSKLHRGPFSTLGLSWNLIAIGSDNILSPLGARPFSAPTIRYYASVPLWRIVVILHPNKWELTHWGRDKMGAIFQTTFSTGYSWIKMYEFRIKSNKISLKFVPKVPINNIPALVQIMTWCRSGDKPLSEPMMDSLLTHICVTRPQRVKYEQQIPVQIGMDGHVYRWDTNQ